MPDIKISIVKGLKSAGITLGVTLLTAFGAMLLDPVTMGKVVKDVPMVGPVLILVGQALGAAILNYTKQMNAPIPPVVPKDN